MNPMIDGIEDKNSVYDMLVIEYIRTYTHIYTQTYAYTHVYIARTYHGTQNVVCICLQIEVILYNILMLWRHLEELNETLLYTSLLLLEMTVKRGEKGRRGAM